MTFWTTFGGLKTRFSKVVRSDPPHSRPFTLYKGNIGIQNDPQIVNFHPNVDLFRFNPFATKQFLSSKNSLLCFIPSIWSWWIKIINFEKIASCHLEIFHWDIYVPLVAKCIFGMGHICPVGRVVHFYEPKYFEQFLIFPSKLRHENMYYNERRE